MTWTVIGKAGEASLSFLVDEDGVSISGEGQSRFSPTTFYVNASKIEALPARWTIYRAFEASEAASFFSLDVSTMKRLDATAVKVTTEAISIIKYYDAIPSYVGFSIFLPDAYFDNVWQLAKLITRRPNMTYWLRVNFDGFSPRRIDDHPKLLTYEEWLGGRPYISSRASISRSFIFALVPSDTGSVL